MDLLGFPDPLMQMPNFSSLYLDVELVSVDPLVSVQVPSPLDVHKSLASFQFCTLAGLVKGKQAGSCVWSRGGGKLLSRKLTTENYLPSLVSLPAPLSAR